MPLDLAGLQDSLDALTAQLAAAAADAGSAETYVDTVRNAALDLERLMTQLELIEEGLDRQAADVQTAADRYPDRIDAVNEALTSGDLTQEILVDLAEEVSAAIGNSPPDVAALDAIVDALVTPYDVATAALEIELGTLQAELVGLQATADYRKQGLAAETTGATRFYAAAADAATALGDTLTDAGTALEAEGGGDLPLATIYYGDARSGRSALVNEFSGEDPAAVAFVAAWTAERGLYEDALEAVRQKQVAIVEKTLEIAERRRSRTTALRAAVGAALP